MSYEFDNYGNADVLVASRHESPEDIAFKLKEARKIVEDGDRGRLDEALKLKREALGIEKLPPGGEAAWFNLDAEPEMDIGASALDDRGYVRWTGDEQYYPSLHTTTLSRHASRIATDRLLQVISDPEASVEPLPGHIWDDRDAQSEAIKTVYVQEGTWREFEGCVFMRLGGELHMAPDGPALRQALQEARIAEEEYDALDGIRVSFHPSYQLPLEKTGYDRNEGWKLHPRVAKVYKYWHEKEYEFALQREAAIRTDDTMAPSQREDALERLPRPEIPGELSPQAEVIIALRAVQNLQGSPDSLSAAQVDPGLLAGTVAKIEDTLRLIIARAVPVQRSGEYDGTNPEEIPGCEGAGDQTQHIPVIGNAAVGLAVTRVIDMDARDGDTRVYGGDEEVFASDNNRPIEELTPSEKRLVRLALGQQANKGRPDIRKEAADMLEHGVYV